jgi:hypothetical protein
MAYCTAKCHVAFKHFYQRAAIRGSPEIAADVMRRRQGPLHGHRARHRERAHSQGTGVYSMNKMSAVRRGCRCRPGGWKPGVRSEREVAARCDLRFDHGITLRRRFGNTKPHPGARDRGANARGLADGRAINLFRIEHFETHGDRPYANKHNAVQNQEGDRRAR